MNKAVKVFYCIVFLWIVFCTHAIMLKVGRDQAMSEISMYKITTHNNDKIVIVLKGNDLIQAFQLDGG